MFNQLFVPTPITDILRGIVFANTFSFLRRVLPSQYLTSSFHMPDPNFLGWQTSPIFCFQPRDGHVLHQLFTL